MSLDQDRRVVRTRRAKKCAGCGATEGLSLHADLILLCDACQEKLRAHKSQEAGERIKAGMARAKARGVRMGNPTPGWRPPVTPEQRAKGRVTAAKKADEFAESLRPLLTTELADLSANATAKELASRNIPTARRGKWSVGKVMNIRRRLGLAE